MIYLFYGSDVERVRTKAFAWVAIAQKKEPNLAYTRLAREDLSPAVLEEVTSSGGLFVKRLLVVLDDPFLPAQAGPQARAADEENVEAEESASSLVEEYLDALVASDNAILIIAPKLLATKAKKLGTKARAVYVFDRPAETKRGFNSALVNAFAARKRAALWEELQRARIAGDAPEMLHGLLHWKARQIHEQKGNRVWKPQEARELSLALIELLQSSRRGGLPLPLALERFALSI
jgi:hypothetical protein